MPDQTPPKLCPLPTLGFIEVSGNDARDFLNSQLSRDVVENGPDRAPLAAWHSGGGRVLALLRALRIGENWLLLTHGAKPGDLIRRLTVFVLRADVELTDASERWRGAAALGDIDGWLQAHDSTLAESPGAVTLLEEVCFIRVGPELAYLVAPAEALSAMGSQFSATTSAEGALAELRLGLIDIPPQLAEQYTPQMLNLDRLGALAFDKGCYPGQEIIARTQNLGTVKRRLFRFSGALRDLPPPGSTILDATETVAGEVIRAARADDETVELLIAIRTDAVDQTLTCAGKPGVSLKRETLPEE